MAPNRAWSTAHGVSVQDPYAELGLKRGHVSKEEVRKAFLRSAMASHPDKNNNSPGAEERFKRVQAAYEQLCNLQNQPPNPPSSSSSSSAPHDVRPASSFVPMDTSGGFPGMFHSGDGIYKESVRLEDMTWDEEEGAYVHECHCSARFILPWG
eukprot:CAMPEP_0202843642 /NCGR_PEP_ID=MMETSP1389-20130828/64941_1 /ASSEMBLY_ACC=CAM_ASM_000865 /TAXON_ID=302021 /ORGANISM="Rhodomonas sp., Strain CCMP768" /LENGTH=152 /DNA_ID=CAMNT_0049520803 /DNA_START=106 /DNA_END=560 /DNA_ORIENTATION=-